MEEYAELLIQLIEANDDKTWLKTFLNLRKGAPLPGGGAGSLEDWGPHYENAFQDVWYEDLYNLVKTMYKTQATPDYIFDYPQIRFRNNLKILRCTNCNKSYQHPNVFERHISLCFIHDNFIRLTESFSLQTLLRPEITYLNQRVIKYREWLLHQYSVNNILVHDFVKGNYVCPHCNKQHIETKHDLYILISNADNTKKLILKKRDSKWEDFEQEHQI